MFTIRNSSSSSSGAISVTPPALGVFTITANSCAGVSLAAGGTCSITVSYAPGTSSGSHMSSLGVSATIGSSTAAVNGTGGTGSGLTLSPPAHNYGRVIGSETQTFTLTNGGSTSHSSITAAIAGGAAPLSVSSTTCGGTLAAGASCTIRVTYTASGSSSVSDHLLVRANGGAVLSASLAGFSF